MSAPLRCLILLLAATVLSAEEIPPQSNVQVINASDLDAVDFFIRGGRSYKGLKPGSRIAGGIFPRLAWDVAFQPTGESEKRRTIRVQFSIENLEGRTLVLVGDAEWIEGMGGDRTLRSRILTIPHDLGPSEKPNRVVVVNGYPEASLTVRLPGFQPKVVAPLETILLSGLPENVPLQARIAGKTLDLPVRFLPPIRSVVVCVYPRPEGPCHVAMEQKSLKQETQE